MSCDEEQACGSQLLKTGCARAVLNRSAFQHTDAIGNDESHIDPEALRQHPGAAADVVNDKPASQLDL